MANQTTEYKCEVCGAVFSDPDSLAKHRRMHDTEKEEEKKDLEQGTSSPTANPGLPPSGGNLPIR